MKTVTLVSCLCVAFVTGAKAQTVPTTVGSAPAPMAASAPTLVPALISYTGIAFLADGKPLAGETLATFLLFKEEYGGEPLWIESQKVAVDAAGHYQVKLGASSSSGLPLDTFASGEVRWLEVQIAGQSIAPRTLLTSVPYAMKAADAATLGGLPASAFVLASSVPDINSIAPQTISPEVSGSNVTTTGGTNFYLPKFNAATTIVNSQIYDTGTSIGIGDVPNSSARLDVNGAMIMRGNMQVTRTGNATTSTGYPSWGFQFYSNAYNSSTESNDNPYFQLQSEPIGNDTDSPSATFNLLFSNNGSKPAETGFSINPNGTVNFASAQKFDLTTNSGVAILGNNSAGGTGVVGTSTSGNGVIGSVGGTVSNVAGVRGQAGASSGYGGTAAVWGDSSSDIGVLGTSSSTIGVSGISNAAQGVQGQSTQADGVFGQSTNGNGVEGASNGSNGVIGGTNSQSGVGVYGYSNASGGTGVAGVGGPNGDGASFGAGTTVAGYVPGNGVAASGGSVTEYHGGSGGVFNGGNASGTGTGGDGIYVVAGTNPDNTYAYAGVFLGNVQVDGTLNGDAENFKIDHPLDPANKYLSHTSIGSSEMVNIYSGNVTTDEQGAATVQLPDWFEAVNGDLRYQLTPIGQFAQAMVATELSNGRFTIRTDKGNVRVSWQITGVRQDAYAKAHPLVVEEEKDTRERGTYRHPELYGQPREKQTEWARSHKSKPRMQPVYKSTR